MKISDVISLLKTLEKKHGDVNLFVEDFGFSLNKVETIDVVKDVDDDNKIGIKIG